MPINQLPSSSSNSGSQGGAVNPVNSYVAPSLNNAPNVSVPGNFSLMPVPPAMTQVIASNNGANAVAKTVYFGNEASFNSTPTDNGSGAESITNTYGDGWSGKGYNQLIGIGDGVQCFGFTLSYVTTSTGAQNGSGIVTANPTVLVATLINGETVPKGYVLSAGARNTQFLAGEMTIQTMFKLNALSQFSYVVPINNTVTLTIMTAPF